MLDLLLKNGEIVDGSGNHSYLGDIAINHGLIQAIGVVNEESKEIIDISGMVVTPGFIDTHSHSDLFLIHDPSSLPKIMQGITTEIIGQDGLGEAPIRQEFVAEWRRYLSGLNGDPPIEWSWEKMEGYLDVLEASKPAVNVVSLVGHGNLRLLAMGMEDRNPSDIELEDMKGLLRESLAAGAIGMSTGLIYAPCVYSDTTELTELCKVVAEYSGVFVVHMRDEGDKLLESIDEVLTIARASGVHAHISHFKAGGKMNWGKSKDALRKLDNAHSNGVHVSYDQYPYTAGSTFLSSLLPSWVHVGGVDRLLERIKDHETRERIKAEYGERLEGGRATLWDQVLVTYVESIDNKQIEGRNLAEIAEIRDKPPVEALMDIVIEEKNMASMASFTMSEDDIKRIMRHPLGMVCTDGLLLGKPHPRAYGAFPRVLGRYVREQRVLGLEEAVRRMTSYPSSVFKLGKRGHILEGFIADLVVFDSTSILDSSTYEEPRRFPVGVEHVIVSGVISVKSGQYTGDNNGKIIRSS
ncbi:MAG: amidohydrolase family protein [Candidatus Bathyarchaeia archaeon]